MGRRLDADGGTSAGAAHLIERATNRAAKCTEYNSTRVERLHRARVYAQMLLVDIFRGSAVYGVYTAAYVVPLA